MGKKYDSYELEIIVSLGFLILFLISTNFISGYSFERAKQIQVTQFDERLALAADYAAESLKSDLVKSDYNRTIVDERLRSIAVLTGVKSITVFDTLDLEIASLTLDADGAKAAGMIRARRFLSYPDGKTFGAVEVAQTNIIAAQLSNLSKWDTLFRVAGLISAIIVSAYFMRVILLPYRRIKREALDFNLDPGEAEKGSGIEYIVNTFKDVIVELEEKRLELEKLYLNSEKRADSLARYNEYILGSITSGVVICNSSGIITRLNPSAQNILQYIEKDCRGKHYKAVFGSEHRLVTMLDDALYRKIIHSRQEIEIRRQDGKRLWLGCSSSLLNDEKGAGVGAALLLIDLTEIRKLQESASYSEKMAALGETAAGLAHEVRNSFAAIVGFANLLRKGVGDDENLQSMVDSIRSESQAAEALMIRFLSFAKPLSLNPESIRLSMLFDSILDNFHHSELTRVKIDKMLPDHPIEFRGDPVLLKQALANLLINACDALPNGGDVRIRGNIEEREGLKRIVISVTDNGAGINQEIAGRIFEPFISGKPDGTGLGLALVKKIVVLHGGTIEAHSKPGKGTRFTIYLPYIESKEPRTKVESTPAIFSPSI